MAGNPKIRASGDYPHGIPGGAAWRAHQAARAAKSAAVDAAIASGELVLPPPAPGEVDEPGRLLPLIDEWYARKFPVEAAKLAGEPQAPNSPESPDPVPPVAQEAPHLRGRPRKKRVDYAPDIAAEVCRRIADGQTLSQIEQDPEMPKAVTVLKWVRSEEGFDQMYEAAVTMHREVVTTKMADEILAIADDDGDDVKMTRWGPKPDHTNVKRSELKVKTRMQLLEKLKPQQWGSKAALDITSGGKPLNPGDMTAVETARRIALALKLGGMALIDVTPALPNPTAAEAAD